MRADGFPSRATVASVMAFGWAIPADAASSNHRWNWGIGSGLSPDSRSGAGMLRSAMFVMGPDRVLKRSVRKNGLRGKLKNGIRE